MSFIFTTGADLERLMNLNDVQGSACSREGVLVIRVHPKSLAVAIELVRRCKPPGLPVEFQTLTPSEQRYTKEFIFISA